MSCPRTGEIQRALSPAELSAFTEHAKTCDACAPILAQLDGAVRTLREDEVPPLAPAKRVALLSAIEAKAAARPSPLRWAAPIVAVAMVVIAVLSFRLPEPSRPDPDLHVLIGPVVGHAGPLSAGDAIEGAVRAAPGARISYRGAELSVIAAAELTFPLEAVELTRGQVTFEVAPRKPQDRFAVDTPLARIEVVGTRFTLGVTEEQTKVAVEEGRVRVLPRFGASQMLDAGASVTIRRPIAKVPPPVDPPPKVEVPPPKKPPLRAVKPKPKPKPRRRPQAERLDEARRVVRKDAARARALAEEVLEEKPAPALEIGALLVLADAHRRTGEKARAAAAYRRVADHPNGAPYLEEALYRRAQMLVSRAPKEALEALVEASARISSGFLEPERAVLEARLRLERGDVPGAAAAVERPKDRTLSLLRMRVEVAEALVARDPTRAKRMVTPVLEAKAAPDLTARARAIDEEVAP